MRKGFTVVELLLVCAIIGVLGAVAAPNFVEARNRARVGESAAQLAADLQRARSSAQRTNAAASLTYLSKTSYRTVIDGRTVTRTLPEKVEITAPVGTVITYSAPFGEVRRETVPVTFAVGLRGHADMTRTVRVVGTTGKVYRQ